MDMDCYLTSMEFFKKKTFSSLCTCCPNETAKSACLRSYSTVQVTEGELFEHVE